MCVQVFQVHCEDTGAAAIVRQQSVRVAWSGQPSKDSNHTCSFLNAWWIQLHLFPVMYVSLRIEQL